VGLVETCFSNEIPGLGEWTARVSVAVLPVPPFVEETAPLVFVYVLAVEAVTFTVTVHEPPAATVAPLKLTVFPFATAVTVPLVHVVAALGVVAFCKPEG
jgi:hypothetical protein